MEELIGADTVNTLPVATLEAYRDHGEPQTTITEGHDEARAVFSALAAFGIDMDQVTSELQEQGVASFAASFDQLLAALERVRATRV